MRLNTSLFRCFVVSFAGTARMCLQDIWVNLDVTNALLNHLLTLSTNIGTKLKKIVDIKWVRKYTNAFRSD